jgi:hypothetical protein
LRLNSPGEGGAVTEAEWLAMPEAERLAVINQLQRTNSRLNAVAWTLSVILVIGGVIALVYSAKQQRKLDEAWSQLKSPGGEEPEVSLARFRQIKLDMELQQVDAIFGFRGMPGRGTEGEISYSWHLNGNSVWVSIGMEDGQVKCAELITANGQQYWLERKN